MFRSEDGCETWRRTSDDRNLRQRAWYYTRIVADPANERSIAVMERIAMTRVGPVDYKGHAVVMYEVRRPR